MGEHSWSPTPFPEGGFPGSDQRSVEEIQDQEAALRAELDAQPKDALVNELVARRMLDDSIDDLKRHATTDPLTGIPNRAVYKNQLERMTGAWSDPFVLLVTDVDGFKPVNDTLGHLVGDLVLRAKAAALKSISREGEMYSRISGDEFGIIGSLEPRQPITPEPELKKMPEDEPKPDAIELTPGERAGKTLDRFRSELPGAFYRAIVSEHYIELKAEYAQHKSRFGHPPISFTTIFNEVQARNPAISAELNKMAGDERDEFRMRMIALYQTELIYAASPLLGIAVGGAVYEPGMSAKELETLAEHSRDIHKEENKAAKHEQMNPQDRMWHNLGALAARMTNQNPARSSFIVKAMTNGGTNGNGGRHAAPEE